MGFKRPSPVDLAALLRDDGPSAQAAAQEQSAPEKDVTGATKTGVRADIWKVSAKVGFDFTPKGLYALMGRLAGHDKQIVVETLVVRGAPARRAEMVLVAHFQKPATTLQ